MGFLSVALVVLVPKSVTKVILVFGVILTHCSFTVLSNIFWSGVAIIEFWETPLSTGHPLILQQDLETLMICDNVPCRRDGVHVLIIDQHSFCFINAG